LKRRNLFALGADGPGDHHVQQEGRDADEDGGVDAGALLELAELFRQEPVRYLVLSSVGAVASVAVRMVSRRWTTSSALPPGASVSDTSLKAPSMSYAVPSAFLPIQSMRSA